MSAQILALAALSLTAVRATAADVPVNQSPVEVMIVGDFHMANPRLDLHNVRVDDMLAPKRQGEIQSVVAALARFRPTKVGVEGRSAGLAERYQQFLAGTLPPVANEVVQLGFRVARAAHADVYSLDVPGDFPYEEVKQFADTHGMSAIVEEQSQITQEEVDTESRHLASGTVGSTLRFLNDPIRVKNGNRFYRTMLHIGAGIEQPGAELLTDWYKRNALICANLVQLARSGDRIIVFFGSGHAYLLRQCVTEMPGYRLVEPNDYLPR